MYRITIIYTACVPKRDDDTMKSNSRSFRRAISVKPHYVCRIYFVCQLSYVSILSVKLKNLIHQVFDVVPKCCVVRANPGTATWVCELQRMYSHTHTSSALYWMKSQLTRRHRVSMPNFFCISTQTPQKELERHRQQTWRGAESRSFGGIRTV